MRTRLSILLPLVVAAACDLPTAAPRPGAPPAAVAEAAATASVAAGGAVSCADLKAAYGATADGNYGVRTGDGNAFVAWCQGMGTATPQAFLTIPQNGVDQNFSTWGGGFREVISRYSKLRLDLATSRANTMDRTFAASTGGPVAGPGVYLYTMNYAQPGACNYPYSTAGRGDVDLRGTPFEVHQEWFAEGWEARMIVNGVAYGWNQHVTVTGQKFALRGGGYCGGIATWIAGDPDFNHQWLQLRFVGPQLASPVAALTATAGVIEGEAVAIAASSSHPAGVPHWTSWSLGDGTSGTGLPPASHTYADRGSYTITFTATDGASAPAVVNATVVVTNPPPVVAPFAGATIYAGETYTASGSFSDPVAETHTATVDYGSGPTALALDGTSFTLSHQYADAGSYTVAVVVTDQDGGTGSASAVVTVLSPAAAAQAAADAVAAMLPAQEAAPLIESLTSASAAIERGNVTAASGKLGAFDNKVEAMLKSRKIDAATAEALKSYSRRVRASMGG